MREIKFRAWDGYRALMVPFDEAVVTFHEGKLYEIHPELRVMQFTRLKDKNGKEIYEGDIVRFGEFSEIKGMLYSGRGIVKFAENVASFAVEIQDEEDGGSITWSIEHFALNQFEVIGNIYENPDLLKSNA